MPYLCWQELRARCETCNKCRSDRTLFQKTIPRDTSLNINFAQIYIVAHTSCWGQIDKSNRTLGVNSIVCFGFGWTIEYRWMIHLSLFHLWHSAQQSSVPLPPCHNIYWLRDQDVPSRRCSKCKVNLSVWKTPPLRKAGNEGFLNKGVSITPVPKKLEHFVKNK